MKIETRLQLLVIFIVALLCIGCGDGRPTRVPVSGTVLIDGKPVEAGWVCIMPDNARPAISAIGSDGRFKLTTYDDDDGVVPGKHTVTVTAIESRNNGTITRYLVPPKYQAVETTDVQVEISEPTEDLTIELSWEGSGKTGPYEERFEGEGDVDPAAVVE